MHVIKTQDLILQKIKALSKRIIEYSDSEQERTGGERKAFKKETLPFQHGTSLVLRGIRIVSE